MGIIEKAKLVAGKAWDNVQNLSDSFKNVIGRVAGYVGTAFEVAKNGSTFIGINYASIDTIRGAIRTYVSGIQAEIAKLNTDISNTNALKGEIAAATSEYVKAVSDGSDKFVSALLAYSDKMYEYGQAMKNKNIKINIKNTITPTGNVILPFSFSNIFFIILFSILNLS